MSYDWGYSDHLRKFEREEELKKLDVGLGTVWWVEESIWIEEAEHQDLRYEDSGRDGHPGLSSRRNDKPKCAALDDLIPMLYGSNKTRRPKKYFCVWGLKKHDPNYETYFGQVFSSVSIELQEFTGKACCIGYRVNQHAHKPKLNAAEVQELKDYLDWREGL